jgi:peptide/nickel transport system permease protein
MRSYLFGRLAQTVVVLFLASVALFLLVRLLPGDPALIYAGTDATDAVIQSVRRSMGLDQPIPVQYLAWLGHVAEGDLGKSFQSDFPVTRLLGQRLPATAELACAALLIAVVVAFPLGLWAAVREGSTVDYLVTGLAGLGLAVPSFWFGIVLILAFALGLGWLPASGYAASLAQPGELLRHLALPAVTLALPTACTLTRFVKSAVLDVMELDHVRTARAKGLIEGMVLRRHVVRNALVTVGTVIGLQIGRLLGGAVIIESVFAWPGLGHLLLDAILNRDYAVVQGGLLTFVVVFLVVNLLTDLAYGFLDPRVRLGAGAGP